MRQINTDENSSSYHWVHRLRSMPVSALQQRMAVFMRTEGSFSGSAPSREGDQWPPMAMASSFPLIPTRNWRRKTDGYKESHRVQVRWKWGIWIKGCGGWKEQKNRGQRKKQKGQQHVQIFIPLRILYQKILKHQRYGHMAADVSQDFSTLWVFSNGIGS